MPSRKAASAAADSLKKRKREKVEDAGRSRKRKPQEGEEEAAAAAAAAASPASKKANAVVKAAPRAKADRTTTWKLSEPMGGAMTDIDPIFSADEEHIIIIYHNSLQIYTTADSLLERRIKLPEDERPKQIATAVLSATTPELVWIGCADGALYRADWTTGAIERVQRFQAPAAAVAQRKSKPAADDDTSLLVGMTSEAVRIGSETKEVLYLSEGSSAAAGWKVTAYDATQLETEAGHVLFTAPPSTSSTIQILRTEDKGRFVVGISGRMVFVGGLKAASTLSSVADLAAAYQFYSLDAADEVSCVDLRVTRRKKGPALDLVVGCTRGTIYAYEDVFTRLHDATAVSNGADAKSAPKKKTNINPRKYHWHPMSVNAVKWSKDGNYLISGGPEEVLVLWQIETSKLSFLPRLTACIENVVVSPRGSSYAVHLDDNSTMILSTAEMVPTFYASGLQSVTLAPSTAGAGAIAATKEANGVTTARVWQPVEAITKPVPAVVNPADASRILVRVGNGQRSTKTNSESPSASLVQAFDVTDFRSINKQPLARSNATDVNLTRNGHHVTEPTITQLCASRDGKWLASVDEWQPPERDVGGIPGEPSLKKVWARDRREVHLKFWAMDRDYELEEEDVVDKQVEDPKDLKKKNAKKLAGYQRPFELISRIDEAHFTTKTESIFGVAADTNHGSRFATLGDDAVVRFWGTKTRVRDGLALKDHTGAPLVSWHCTQSVSLPLGESSDKTAAKTSTRNNATKSTVRRSGALAYSEDGSTVFAAFGAADEAVLYTIDAESGVVRNSLQGMFRGEVRGVAVLGSSLVLLSADLRVYDIVADELRYGVNLMHNIPAANVEAATAMTQLAVGRDANKFVVAVPYKLASAAPLAAGASITGAAAAASATSTAATASTRFASRLIVFSPDHATSVYAKNLPTLAVSVLPAVGLSGFMVIDSAAQVWSIADAADTASLGQSLDELQLQAAPEEVKASDDDDDEDDEDDKKELVKADEADEADEDDEEMDDAAADAAAENDDEYGIEDAHDVVIAPEKLREIFDAAPSTAATSIEELFWEVSGLLSGLPSLVRSG